MRAGIPAVMVLVLVASCDDGTAPPLPEPIAADAALATGARHTCVLDAAGEAYCWGLNTSGQLGRSSAGESSTEPGRVSGGHRFVAIDAAGSTTCALTAEGQVWCWGDNGRGQLAAPGIEWSAEPLRVETPEPLVEIDVGYHFVCGRAASGAAYCWGYNHLGQAGSGPTDAPVLPTLVSGGHAFDAITAGLFQACGLVDGVAYCWGGGSFGSLGTGDTENRNAPTPVAGGHRFRRLVTGTTTTCGVTLEGATYCWGLGYYGSLGSGTTASTQHLEPTPLALDPGFALAGAGDENSILTVSCGLDDSGAAYCWGPNAYGGLGTQAAMDSCGPINAAGQAFDCSGDPVAVEGGLRFAVLRPSDAFVCGLTTDSELYCWGDNGAGQLGVAPSGEFCDVTGDPRPCSLLPVRAAEGLGLPGSAAIALQTPRPPRTTYQSAVLPHLPM